MKNKKLIINSRVFFGKISVVAVVFLFSLFILPFYIEGDQKAYRDVYEKLADLEFSEGFVFYSLGLSSIELVHFILSWLLSPYLNKDLFIASSNAFFAYFALSLFQKWGGSIVISSTLILTNFYFFVLYFSAERLKYGFIFLSLSLLFKDRFKYFYATVFLAIISHAQVVIIYGALIANFIGKKILILIRSGKASSSRLLIAPLLFIPLFLIWDHLVLKFQAYSDSGGVEGLLRIIVFFLLSLFYSRDRETVFLLFLIIIISVYFVGGERVNIFGYFIFLYYGFKVRRGWNFGVITTTLYYSYSSIGYLDNILKHGDGFFVR